MRIWLDKLRTRKQPFRVYVLVALLVLIYALAIAAGSIDAARVPDSFPGWLCASAGAGGIATIIEIGAGMVFIIIIIWHSLGKKPN